MASSCRILVGVNDCPDCDSLGGPCCVAHGQAPSGAGRRGRSIEGWTQFDSDTILINRSGTAHNPEPATTCPSPSSNRPSGGWITAPGHDLWHQLSEAIPAQATGGNVELAAIHRCLSCSARLG
jgi:hypothetical protein